MTALAHARALGENSSLWQSGLMLYRLLSTLVFAMVTGPGGAWARVEAASETET